MAEKKSVKKPTQTVRERSQSDAAKAPKKRRIQQTAKSVGAARQSVKKAAAPLAKPFQNKPARLIGKVLGTVLLINYFISSWRELKQVTWPNRKETIKLTLAVFTFTIIFGLIIIVTDYGLDKVFHKLLVS